MSIPPFDEILLPFSYNQGTQGGPKYQNRVVSSDSGYEQRVQMWANGRLTYTIGFTADPMNTINSVASMNTIISFFRARKGRMRGFRFRDWSDYIATLEPLVYNATSMQLIKTYNDTYNSEVRNIVKPSIGGPFTLYRNGTPEGCTLDTSTGVVTGFYTAGSGDVFTWSGTFDVPVRFDVDQLSFTQDSVGQSSISSIPIIEVLISS
jgi:uncharacterized protein (TIGR02217 family)